MNTKKSMWRAAAGVAAALALALGMPLAAQAATHTVAAVSPGVGVATNATISVTDGDTAVVNGSGFAANAQIFVGACDRTTLGTACDEDATVEVTASASGTFSVSIPLSESFTSWNPHDDSTGGTIECSTIGSTACGILVVQHSGAYPYVVQPLSFL